MHFFSTTVYLCVLLSQAFAEVRIQDAPILRMFPLPHLNVPSISTLVAWHDPSLGDQTDINSVMRINSSSPIVNLDNIPGLKDISCDGTATTVNVFMQDSVDVFLKWPSDPTMLIIASRHHCGPSNQFQLAFRLATSWVVNNATKSVTFQTQDASTAGVTAMYELIAAPGTPSGRSTSPNPRRRSISRNRQHMAGLLDHSRLKRRGVFRKVNNWFKHAGDKIKHGVGHAVDEVKHGVGHAVDEVKKEFHKIEHHVNDIIHKVKHTAEEVIAKIKHGVEDFEHRLEKYGDKTESDLKVAYDKLKPILKGVGRRVMHGLDEFRHELTPVSTYENIL